MKSSSNDKPARKGKEDAHAHDSVSALVRRIEGGEVATAGLTKGHRQQYVQDLVIEGYFTGEIAELLGVSDRTVRRDLRAIRAAHSVERDPETVMEMVGRLVWQADIATNRIRRAVRLKTVKPSDRIEAEHTC